MKNLADIFHEKSADGDKKYPVIIGAQSNGSAVAGWNQTHHIDMDSNQ